MGSALSHPVRVLPTLMAGGLAWGKMMVGSPGDPHHADHLAGLDILRFGAVLGVVWFHGDAPGGWIAYSGLPTLLLITSYLSSLSSLSLNSMVSKRAVRLFIPFAAWSAIYGLLLFRSSGPGAFRPTMLLYGTTIHLWYLPFAFVASLVAAVISRAFRRHAPDIACPACLLFGLFALRAATSAATYGEPFDQWVFAAASVLLGVAIAAATQNRRRAAWLATIAASVAACGLTSGAWYRFGLPYSVGVTLVCGGLAWPVKEGWISRRLAPLAMGIYLVHPLVYDGLRKLNGSGGGGRATIVILISILAAQLFRGWHWFSNR